MTLSLKKLECSLKIIILIQKDQEQVPLSVTNKRATKNCLDLVNFMPKFTSVLYLSINVAHLFPFAHETIHEILNKLKTPVCYYKTMTFNLVWLSSSFEFCR